MTGSCSSYSWMKCRSLIINRWMECKLCQSMLKIGRGIQNHANMHFLGGIRMGNTINLMRKKEFLTLVENMSKQSCIEL